MMWRRSHAKINIKAIDLINENSLITLYINRHASTWIWAILLVIGYWQIEGEGYIKNNYRIQYPVHYLYTRDCQNIKGFDNTDNIWKQFVARTRQDMIQANPLCDCGNKATQIHHNKYKIWNNEDIQEIITICTKCHKKLHKNDVFHNINK